MIYSILKKTTWGLAKRHTNNQPTWLNWPQRTYRSPFWQSLPRTPSGSDSVRQTLETLMCSIERISMNIWWCWWENMRLLNVTLWLCNIAMVKPWPIEIDGLPFLNGWIFPWRTVSHNQMVYYIILPSGKLTKNYGKIHHFWWVNPRTFDWAVFNSLMGFDGMNIEDPVPSK